MAKDKNREAAGFINLAYLLNDEQNLQDQAKRLGKPVEQKLVVLYVFRRILMTAAQKTLDGT